MPISIDCFKAYDIRGQIPSQLNPYVAYRIGNATAEFLGAKKMVLGRDIRLSSHDLSTAVAKGIRDSGAEVMDIQLCGTEMVYFATDYVEADGGIMVTAGHNPADYNGLKIVREKARPVSADTGLLDIRRLAEADKRLIAEKQGLHAPANTYQPYIDHVLSCIDIDGLKPLKLVVNPGNGGAAIALDGLRKKLPFEFIEVNYEYDGTFPNGIPNPMLPQNQAATAEAVVEHKADLGIAWDADFDRCFLFDEHGGFIDGYYIFREFAGADSGMIPWLLVAELMSSTGKTLSQLVGERQAKFPASGEINREVADAKQTLNALYERYADAALQVDDSDGYSFEFPQWRFNIRMSNTEPVVRLNVESRGDVELMQEKTQEVLTILES